MTLKVKPPINPRFFPGNCVESDLNPASPSLGKGKYVVVSSFYDEDTKNNCYLIRMFAKKKKDEWVAVEESFNIKRSESTLTLIYGRASEID